MSVSVCAVCCYGKKNCFVECGCVCEVIYKHLAFGKAPHERFRHTFVATDVGLISSVSAVFCFPLSSKYIRIAVTIWTVYIKYRLH